MRGQVAAHDEEPIRLVSAPAAYYKNFCRAFVAARADPFCALVLKVSALWLGLPGQVCTEAGQRLERVSGLGEYTEVLNSGERAAVLTESVDYFRGHPCQLAAVQLTTHFLGFTGAFTQSQGRSHLHNLTDGPSSASRKASGPQSWDIASGPFSRLCSNADWVRAVRMAWLGFTRGA